MAFETGITSKTKCSRSGRRALEKIRMADFENVMLDQSGDRNLKRFIDVARENGLKVPFVHIDCRDVTSIWSLDEQGQAFVDYATNTIKLCGDNGVGTVIIHPTYKKPQVSPSEIGLERVSKLVQIAKSSGVKIALENIDAESHPYFKYLMERIDSSNFGFCFDTGHWNLYMPETDLLGKYGNRLMATHIQDNFGAQGRQDLTWKDDMHLLPFDGNIDFDKVACGIAKTGYTGPVMLESHRSKSSIDDYKGMPPKYFLDAAHNRAVKLAKMIDSYRTNDIISI